jgi:hypothetical protein
VMSQIVADSRLQLTHAAECASPDASVGKQTKQAFDLVQPTGAGGSAAIRLLYERADIPQKKRDKNAARRTL